MNKKKLKNSGMGRLKSNGSNLPSDLLNRYWTKFWTRDFGLLRYYVYIESNKLDFYQDYFGQIFHYALIIPDGKLMSYHHDKKELQQLTQKMYQVACSNFDTFFRFSKKTFKWMQDFIEFNQNLKISNISNKELEPIFLRWYEKYLYWQIGVYFFFVLEPVVTEKFLFHLEEYLTKKKQKILLLSYTDIVMAPEQMNAVTSA